MIPSFSPHPLIKLINHSLNLPSPANLTMLWSFGSLSALCLGAQLIRGLFLSIHYCGDIVGAFDSISHICRDVQYGWLLRAAHANGARFFFICLYGHIGRGLYYGSFLFSRVWLVGVVLLLVVIATAFFGYVLPWGQISFWGATVITNLFSVVPYLGGELVVWLWGGYSVDNATLTRFYRFHFLLPFIVARLVGVHLLFLHQTGSGNPLGLNRNYDKIPFHPYFSVKDLFGALLIIFSLLAIRLISPWYLGDPENFIPANPIVTPIHIQPEWYYLIAYAILRSIPRKLGGVIALAVSVGVLAICPFLYKSHFRGYGFYPISQLYFWGHIRTFTLLVWIGARPVEEPYVFTGQVLSCLYFIYYLLNPYLTKFWDLGLSQNA